MINYMERGTANAKQPVCTRARRGEREGEEGSTVKPTAVVDSRMTNV